MRYLKIELLRTWRSFTMFLPVVILLAATLAFLLQHGAAADGLAPLHFYSVGLLMPLALLTPVVTQLREQRLRAGGTLWRPQNLWATHAARLAVATGYAGIGHLLALGLVRAFSPAFFLVETLVFAGGYAMGLLLWSLLRTASVVLAPLAGIAAVILGLVGVDTDQWYRNPLCWHLRPTLPIVGVEANSTLAAPDSPIHDISPVWPTLAHLGLGAGCFVAAMALAAHPLASPHSSRTIHDVTLSGPARLSTPRALALALPWRIWAALTVLMWAILAVARARYGVATGAALYGLAAVPLTATIVGVTAWTAHKDAWPGLMLRPRAGRFLSVVLAITTCASTGVLAIGGVLAGATPYQLIVTPGLVAACVTVTVLCTQVSLGAALSGSFLALIWGIVVGGSVLSTHPLWWRTGPWAWAWVVHDFPERWIEIVLVTWLITITLALVARRRHL